MDIVSVSNTITTKVNKSNGQKYHFLIFIRGQTNQNHSKNSIYLNFTPTLLMRFYEQMFFVVEINGILKKIYTKCLCIKNAVNDPKRGL